ncbi:MAG: FG-GAP-like repeat-containing protein [Ignavibacteriaceae bacterium]
MHKLFTIIISILAVAGLNAQDIFQRSSTIHTLKYEPGGGGFGNIVAGVDFDGDGLPEIYACNTNMIDRDGELIPRLYKFEWNETTSSWDSVWSATAPLDKQNTWPALAWGDLDKDGRPEIYWAPVNYSPYPDVARVLVYEYAGDGSDNMGVDDGFGGFLPNASTDIVKGDGLNLRPIKFVVDDIDSDGTDELIFCDRGGDYHFGVLSVDNIPDLGDGSETWTLEANGKGDTTITTGSKYDFSIIGNTIYLFNDDGKISPVKYDNGSYTVMPALDGVGENYGSFKGSVTADLDNDGTDEIILGGWDNPTKVFVLKQVADTLQTFAISDTSINVETLNGAAAGDLDADGHPDFVFGTRGSPASVPNNAILRVEFQGGDITDPANYVTSIIDSMLVPEEDNAGGQLDVVAIGNLDGDPADEVVYTQGYTRGVSNDTTADAAIVDLQHTAVSVRMVDNKLPSKFYLNQNYPNPFNPSTTIEFGLTREMGVELKIYNILGQEVMTLIDGQLMKAGVYKVNFKASDLASGTYVYRLKAGSQVMSKKMLLLK